MKSNDTDSIQICALLAQKIIDNLLRKRCVFFFFFFNDSKAFLIKSPGKDIILSRNKNRKPLNRILYNFLSLLFPKVASAILKKATHKNPFLGAGPILRCLKRRRLTWILLPTFDNGFYEPWTFIFVIGRGPEVYVYVSK